MPLDAEHAPRHHPGLEKKRAAIECMAGQEHLWEYYTRVAEQRGVQAARNSDKKIAYGEAYEAVFPHVVETLVATEGRL